MHLSSGFSLHTCLLSPQYSRKVSESLRFPGILPYIPCHLYRTKGHSSPGTWQDALLQEHPWGCNSPKKTHSVSSTFPFASFYYRHHVVIDVFSSLLLQKVTRLNQPSLTAAAFHSQTMTIPCKMSQSGAEFVSPEEEILSATLH